MYCYVMANILGCYSSDNIYAWTLENELLKLIYYLQNIIMLYYIGCIYIYIYIYIYTYIIFKNNLSKCINNILNTIIHIKKHES